MEIHEKFIMSNDSVVLYCEQLKLSVGALDTNRASRYLDAIDQLFNDRISDSEIGKHNFFGGKTIFIRTADKMKKKNVAENNLRECI